MHWRVAYTTAVAVGILGKSVGAFQQRPSFLNSQGTSTTTTTATRSQLHVGGLGWDNDNFLDSLSKGSKAREEANEEYFSSSRFGRPDINDYDNDEDDIIQDDDAEFRRRAAQAGEDLSQEMTQGAELTAEMKAKMKASHTPEEEATQGGKMFRELLARAQEKQRVAPPPPPPPTPPSPPTPASAAPFSADMDLSNMSVEQQAALFRQLMQQQQQQQESLPQQAVAPPPPQPKQQYPPQGATVAPDGRRIGRNRDADAIVNSADLYFAQLKLDSAVRNTARYSGNEDYANQVFVDPILKEIKIQENPYTAEQRKKQRELYETIPEEMINPAMFQDNKPVDKSYAGVSYKKILKQRRNNTGNNSNDMDNKGPAAAASNQVAPPAPMPAAVAPPAAAAAPVAPPAPVASTPSVGKESSPQSPATGASTATVPSLSSKPSVVSGDFRQDTRTLMGLTLKHRGGPGFGVGRIQGADIDKFEALAEKFLETVQQEAAVKPEGSGTPVEIPKNTVPASARGADLLPPPAAAAAAASTVPDATTTAPPAASAPIDMSRADSMIACIEGAVLMYRNSPPGLRDSVMVTLRAALLSAISTCNELIATSPPVDVSTLSSNAPTSSSMNTDSMIACIEGAVQVYRNSPAELRETVLVTLRAALLSAVYTCNELITQAESAKASQMQEPIQSRMPPLSSAAPAQAAPASVVSEPPKQEAASQPVTASPAERQVAEKAAPKVYSGNDENTKLLNDIYDRIKEAAGDGKMGLSKDLTPQQAKELSNDITDMRMLLVDELENGIPEKEETKQNYAEMLEKPAKESNTAKKYSELLAKAKAEKRNDAKE